MAQHRELVPVTVYLPPDVLDAIEAEAQEEAQLLSAKLRGLILAAWRSRKT